MPASLTRQDKAASGAGSGQLEPWDAGRKEARIGAHVSYRHPDRPCLAPILNVVGVVRRLRAKACRSVQRPLTIRSADVPRNPTIVTRRPP